MNKLFTLALALVSAGTLAAAPLSPEEALARVSEGSARSVISMSGKHSLLYTVKSQSERPAAYVFAKNIDSGFMIVSADDNAYPLLGYSDSGVFNPESMPEAMKWWLTEYARMIEWANGRDITKSAGPAAPAEWTAVHNLCKTKWDQGAPFNDECPVQQGTDQRCYTGCVATSMAQVMKYFNYPESGKGSVTYTPVNVGTPVSMDFSATKFDWSNMLDVYSYGKFNDTQSLAVATLMKACGYAVQMDYGVQASGASGASISKALFDYFNYDVNCRTEYRMFYSMSDWSKIIYDNLKNIGPVIINGHDPGQAGHSFVCDGYDGKGYFHFNWGWGGMADGYFALDALNPDAMGIGGYGSGFNFSQNAIIGIQPPTGSSVKSAPNLVQTGNLSAKLSDSLLTLSTSDYKIGGFEGWINYGSESFIGSFGVKFEPVSGNDNATIVNANIAGKPSFELEPGQMYTTIMKLTAAVPSLADGQYKVTLMTKADGYDWMPILVPWGYNNFVYMDKSATGWSISIPDFGYLKLTDASIETELYNGFNVLVKATIVNDSDKELTQGFTPRLIHDKKTEFVGPNILLTVGPNETVVKDLIFSFTPVEGVSFTSPTDYQLNFINSETARSYGVYGSYTMTTGPRTSLLSLKELSVVDAPLIDMQYAGTTQKAYAVLNMSDFDVNFSYSVRAGYFDKVMKLSVFEVSPESIYDLSVVEELENVYRATPFLQKGEVSDNIVKISFPEAKDGVLYALVAQQGGTGSWKNVGSITYFTPATAGISDVIDDVCGDVEYYDLQGVRIDNPCAGQLVIRRMGANAEKIIF